MTFNPFDELFAENDPARDDAASTPDSPAPEQPLTRREARARETGAPLTAPIATAAATTTATVPSAEPTPTRRTGPLTVEPARRKRRTGLWVGLSILLVFLLGVGGFGLWAWTTYEDQIRDVLGWTEPNDYPGSGTGEVLVTIQEGDIGSDVALTLVQNGVVKTYEAFYDLLLIQDPQVPFFPGTYRLKAEMSAQSALAALQDPANKLELTVLIQEGKTIWQTYELLAAGTGLTVADFEAAGSDVTRFGVPEAAPSLEGFLFPATYTFQPGMDAPSILQQMVDRTMQSLDAAGVAPEDRLRVMTTASLIQREARLYDDFFKVSRVIQNRLDRGMKLELDSTAQYDSQAEGSVWSTGDALNDDNPFNTYFHTGLPIGPIAAAGDDAIDAALHPVDGPWIFFVSVNLATGETVFSETVAQHDAAVEQLRAWCRASDENAAHCA